jgi:hypothetical protein
MSRPIFPPSCYPPLTIVSGRPTMSSSALRFALGMGRVVCVLSSQPIGLLYSLPWSSNNGHACLASWHMSWLVGMAGHMQSHYNAFQNLLTNSQVLSRHRFSKETVQGNLDIFVRFMSICPNNCFEKVKMAERSKALDSDSSYSWNKCRGIFPLDEIGFYETLAIYIAK